MIRSLALVAALALGFPAAAAERIHGADSHYASADVALAWAVLRHADEAETAIVIRVVDPAGRGWHVKAEGVDPFGGGRTIFAAARPVGSGVDVVVPRRLLADHPSLELHFAASAVALGDGKPDLTVYYLGVPDTTPEFLERAALDAYLARKVRVPSR